MELLKELCETPAIPGREKRLIEIMKRELAQTCDEVRIDGMGNVIGIRRARSASSARPARGRLKKVMIAGHMDEIGFIVSHIDKNGFIRFSPRGGHIPTVQLSQRVRICGKTELIGIIEGAPPFLNPEDKKQPELKNLYIDTGMPEKELRKRVQVGDMIVLERGFQAQGDMYVSKAFDNRVGCYLVLEAMKRLKKNSVEIYAVGTSQEEVGTRGARGAARSIEPDIGIALDVTAAFDVPGIAEHQQVTKLGEGAAIKIADAGTISNHGIVEFLRELARKNKIRHQMEILPFGGTDAVGMQMFGGGAVGTISVPTRYVHSPNEMIHRKDLESAVALLVKFLENCQDCELEF